MVSTSVPMTYLNLGQPDQALWWVFTQYIGYGIVLALWGIAIFATIYKKNKSMGIVGFAMAFLFAVIGSQLPPEVQGFFFLFLSFILFWLLYRIAR